MSTFNKFLYNYWKILIIVIICLVFLGGVIYYYYFYDKDDDDSGEIVTNEEVVKDDIVLDTDTEIEENIYIDIKGEVVNPGIYKLVLGSRVIDAINAAGGLTIYADTSVNNLSMILKDEMVIVIYSYDEVDSFSETISKNNIINDACSNYNGGVNNSSCITTDVDTIIDSKVNINTAAADLLMSLPGIGETKAKTIIDYRNENGLFVDISDIMNVTGIGEALYEQIKSFITV